MNFIPFSQRNGLKDIPSIIIKDDLPPKIINSIHNFFTELLSVHLIAYDVYEDMIANFGRYYLNRRIEGNQHKMLSPISYIDSADLEWFEKIDIIEWCLNFLFHHLIVKDMVKVNLAINDLNKEFERHCFGYRIVDGIFIETTSNHEIECIKETITTKSGNVLVHIHQAMHSISPANPTPDYRNSIKESISAIGCFLREKFGGNTLGDSLNILQKNQPSLLHRFVILAIKDLYTYTNQSNTGIRRELLSIDYIPDHSDALFMLVQACSIINYIHSKMSVINDRP